MSVDPVQIERVLVNLIENALKFSPADTSVHVTIAHVGDEVVIRVDDLGPGLRPDELERVFEPFQRGAAASAGAGRRARAGDRARFRRGERRPRLGRAGAAGGRFASPSPCRPFPSAAVVPA